MNPDAPSRREIEEFIQAAANGECAAVTDFFNEYGPVAIESKDRYGMTALMWAAGNGYNDMVELLLQNGAALEKYDEDGWTPLMWAAHRGQLETVALLLERGASCTHQDKMGHTAATLAGVYNQIEVTLFLERWPAKQKKRQEIAENKVMTHRLKRPPPSLKIQLPPPQ